VPDPIPALLPTTVIGSYSLPRWLEQPREGHKSGALGDAELDEAHDNAVKACLKDQELARRWMTGYLKGVRDYLKAFEAKQGRDDVVNILVKYSTVKDPKLYDVMELPYLDPNGQMDRSSVDAQYKWFVEKGLYTGKKTLGDVIDLSHVDYAVQRLGRQ